MKVIICGAGRVGHAIASYLADEGNEVTMVDTCPKTIAKINETLDVSGIVGSGAQPDVLDIAGAQTADLLIAATHLDEVNMVACQVAHTIFNVPKKIARIREDNYLEPEWANLFSRDHMPIDVIISPEKEVARAIIERISNPGSFNIISLADDAMKLVSVVCHDDCPIINTPMKQIYTLFPDLKFKIIAIIRGSENIIPNNMEQIFPGDEVYFVVDSGHITRTMAAFGHEEQEARRILIIGGGRIGVRLAQELHKESPDITVRMIENNANQAKVISEILPNALIIHGDALTREILEEANIGYTEACVAVTEYDESNILASLLAREYGCPQTISLLSNTTYTSMASSLGIDAVVNPRSITISTILRHVRHGRISSASTLRDGFAEILEINVPDTATALLYKSIKSIKLPEDTIFGALIRDNEVIVAHDDTTILPNDRVVILTAHNQIKKIEELFSSLGSEYF